jgi:hypothetical protein
MPLGRGGHGRDRLIRLYAGGAGEQPRDQGAPRASESSHSHRRIAWPVQTARKVDSP